MYGKRKGMKHGGTHRKPMGGGGYSMKKRKMYKHGGVAHGGEAMPKAKPC